MPNLYFNHAATSWPKAPGVSDVMKYYLDQMGTNINRGELSASHSAGEVVLETREAFCRLFRFSRPENVIFTMNVTQALNILLKGILQPNDHCLVSSMEHNAVMRPLTQLAQGGVSVSRVQADAQGFLDPENLRQAIKGNTKVVALTHASNVCGTILPLKEIGEICKERGVLFIVDAAQTGGVVEISCEDLNIDALAFTGHKGLLGPPGIGGFLVTPKLAALMDPLITGGTGSLSESEEIPPFLPDKFEPGTPNIPGIFGLHTALRFLEREGIENLHNQAMEMTSLFLEGVANIKGVEIIGPQGIGGRTAVVSLDFPGRDNGEVAHDLERFHGLITRSGMHCAPSAHKTLGTFPQGTVRFSFGYGNTIQEIRQALDAIRKLVKE